MKVLLWDPTTRLYVRAEDQWTSERAQAHDFGQSAYAAAFAMSKHLAHVEALLTFERPEHDLALSVQVPQTRESETADAEPTPSGSSVN